MAQLDRLQAQLDSQLEFDVPSSPHLNHTTVAPEGVTREQAFRAIHAGLISFVSHVEARVASSLGEAFYTIGPCGEELLAAPGVLLEPTDAMALHYRHLATQVARHLPLKGAQQIMLDRARAHTVSAYDAVTGGVHCSLGGDDFSFLVTSTLASQTSPAVGRALASGLAHQLKVGSCE
jgi:2-oxoisovalerate dehydrogenase E1 component